MILYRIFNFLSSITSPSDKGGPLYCPRAQQGAGRHDIPHKDGVVYFSLIPFSSIAEELQRFRGRKISNSIFRREHLYDRSIATFEVDASAHLLDLDNPKNLVDLGLRISEVMTSDRKTTQAVSEKIYDHGYDGFLWPSSLDGGWINATLFQSRVVAKLKITSDPEVLTTQNDDVIRVSHKFLIELPE